MPKIYKRYCNTCNKYYESQGKKYCSFGCRVPWNRGLKGFRKGIPKTKEHKEKISKANIGKHQHRLGKKDSEETKLKKSIAFSGSKNPMFGKNGELNPNWKGGCTSLLQIIRTSQKYSDWRSKIFIRDNFRCQDCNKLSESDIEVHHFRKRIVDILRDNNIITFEQSLLCIELWDISNGITLCEECHRKINKLVRIQ